MIDTHAHIYLPEFDKDRPYILEKAMAAGITKILMPAIDSSTHAAMFKLDETYPECISMIGLHPCSVNQNYEDELKVVDNYFKERSFIAVGEIGLDFYWDVSFRKQQFLLS